LMKYDSGVPSASSTSMRPVFAQKLMPWAAVEMTLQLEGSSVHSQLPENGF
jgi:hypothetical protein